MNWIENYKNKVVSGEDAVKCIKSGNRIYIGGGCGSPEHLANSLVNRANELNNVEVVHILTTGKADYTRQEMRNHFQLNALFVGGNVRDAVNRGNANYIPVFLGEIPRLFRQNLLPIDVAMVTLTPPDEHGFCSYGVEVGVTKPATESAKIIIAEINDQMPRVLGNSFIHISKISYLVPNSIPLPELKMGDMSDLFKKIGKNVADLIDDGSTLQMGIGGIPDAVLFYLENKRDLGIHTEMFSDGIIGLIQKGVITNEKKNLHQGKITAGFALGTNKLFKYIDNNPMFELHPIDYINDPFNISKNDNMVAINSAIQVDITGQVVSDSIGTRIYSGFGGQVDFIRGASRSKGGKPVIALPSTTKNEAISKIVAFIDKGAGVVTSRADVHYVITEYGIAYLHGKNLKQRAKALINIAHPKFRDELTKTAKERDIFF